MNELRKLMEAIDIAEDSTALSAFTITDGNGHYFKNNIRIQTRELMTANPAFVQMWVKRSTAQKRLDTLIEQANHENWANYYKNNHPSTWHVVEVRISEI